MNYNYSLINYSKLLFLSAGASVFVVGTICYYLLPSAVAKIAVPIFSGLFAVFFFKWHSQKRPDKPSVEFTNFTAYSPLN